MPTLRFWSRCLGTLALATLFLSQGWLMASELPNQPEAHQQAVAVLQAAPGDPAAPPATSATPAPPPANPFFGRDGGEQVLKDQLGVQTGSLAEGGADPIKFLRDMIATVAKWLLQLLASLSVLALIYAGFLWVTAHGEAEPVTKAKQIVGYAIAGLLLAFFSYAIVTAVTGLRNQPPNTGGSGTASSPATDPNAATLPPQSGPGGASQLGPQAPLPLQAGQMGPPAPLPAQTPIPTAPLPPQPNPPATGSNP